MATNVNNCADQLSKLSLQPQSETEIDDSIDPAWLTRFFMRHGYSFRCSLPFKQLIDKQLGQPYFQKILSITEQKNQIHDYHMKLRCLGRDGFTVDFLHKDTDDHPGPVQVPSCISCDMNSPLSQASLIKLNPTTCIWLDAQLRMKLIITPRRHIERLSDMDKAEMEQFWHDAQTILDEEGCYWQSMIINHGKYRNHAHLHMKINIPPNLWHQNIIKKYGRKVQQMAQLINEDKNNLIQNSFGDRKFYQSSGIRKK